MVIGELKYYSGIGLIVIKITIIGEWKHYIRLSGLIVIKIITIIGELKHYSGLCLIVIKIRRSGRGRTIIIINSEDL